MFIAAISRIIVKIKEEKGIKYTELCYENEIPMSTYDDIVNNINTGSTYVVTFAYDPTTGYITSCGIVEQGRGLTNSLVNSNSTTTNTLTDTTNTAGGISNLITNAESFLNDTN